MFNPRKYIRTGSAKRRGVLPHSHHQHHPSMSNLITVSSAKQEARRGKTPTKSPHANATFILESPKNLRFQSHSSREDANHYSQSVATLTKTKRPRHRSSDQDEGRRPCRAHYYRMEGSDKQPEIVHYEDLKKIKFQLPHVFQTAVASERSATNIRRLFTYLLQNIQEGDTNMTESISKNHPIYLYSKKYKKKLLKRLKKSDKLNKDRSVETSSTSVNQISDRLDDPFAIMDHANELTTSACANAISELQTKSSYASSIDNLFQDAQNHLRNNTPIPHDDDDIAEYFVSLLQESPMLEQFRSLETEDQAAAIDFIQGELDQLDPSEVPGQITRSDQTETATQFCTYLNDQTIKLDSTQIEHPISIPEPQQDSGIPAAESLEQHSSNTFKLLPINTNTPPESSQVAEKIPEKITPEITLGVPVENMNSTSAHHHPAKIRLNQPKKQRKNKRQRLSRVKAQTSSGENSAVISIVKRRRKVDQMNSKSADQLNLRHSLPTASLSLCQLRKSENVTTQEILKSSWQPHDGLEVILKPKSHLLRGEEEVQQQYDPTQKALAEQCYWVMNCFNMCCPRPFICPPICCSPCPPQAQQQQQQCRWSFECTPSNHLTGCGNNDHNCSNNGMNHNSGSGNNCFNGYNNGNNCSNANNSGHPYQSSGRSNCGEMNMCNPRKCPILSPSHLSPPKYCPRSPSITPARRSSGGFGSSPTPSDASSSRATNSSDYSSPIPPRLPPKPMDRYPAPHSSPYCCSSSMMPPQSVPIPVPYPVPCYAPAPTPCFMPQPFFFPFCPQPTAAAPPPTRSGHGARSSCEVNRSTGKGFPNPSGTGFPSHSGTGFPNPSGTGFPGHSGTGFPGHSGTAGFPGHSGGMCCPTPIAFCCPFNPSQAGGNMGGLPKENSCEMGKPCKRAKRRAKRRNGKRSSCSCCCKC